MATRQANKNSITAPKFRKDQTVEFIGGTGKIKQYHFEICEWIYLVEMKLGLEPSFGRIGCETMILLPEIDIFLLVNQAK